ncbi:uncharacterized protein [Heptranchias perlo]|uniref:uncharacterized protein isoform X2 n=1 Tax=Heptranchias perlo TaxID=212740 RepID=UPI0035598F3A
MPALESRAFTITVEQSIVNASVGDTVLLSVAPSELVRDGNWNNGVQIAVWIETSLILHNDYTGRVELFPNSSLLLQSVSVSDSGGYTVTMTSYTGNSATAKIVLRVFEPISFVYVSSNVSNPVQQNDSVCLTCHVLGDFTRIVWSVNRTILHSNERIILSFGNLTLTIIGFNKTDSGGYQCTASSPVSERNSEPYNLSIYDPPFIDSLLKCLLFLVVPVILFCIIFTRIRINCCDCQCPCCFLTRYIFYCWVSCCNNRVSENICDDEETGNLSGTWVACCSNGSKTNSNSPYVEEPRSLSGLSISCCSNVLRNKSESQGETKTGNLCGILLSCCSGRSLNEQGCLRHCCCVWMSCCKTGLKENVESSNYRGVWMSCCDRGLRKGGESQKHNEIRELCDFWIACCNKGSEESIEIYVNPITSSTGQQQLSNFTWTSSASAIAKEAPLYAVTNKKKQTGNDAVNNGQNPPITKPIQLHCHYADLQNQDSASNTRNVTSSNSEVKYSAVKF